MFSLFYGFWKFLFQKDEFFVLILGLDDSGKTTFLEQAKTKFNKNYKGINLSKITATVGLNIGRIDLHGIRINFWDLGGQEELQALWDKYYVESHGIIYMIDASDIERVDQSKEAFDKMITNECLSGIPLLMVANKQDKPDTLTLRRIKEIFKPNNTLIGDRDFHAIEASALKGDGIYESIEWMTRSIKKNMELRPPHRNED